MIHFISSIEDDDTIVHCTTPEEIESNYNPWVNAIVIPTKTKTQYISLQAYYYILVHATQ